jgi:hypothetical protein
MFNANNDIAVNNNVNTLTELLDKLTLCIPFTHEEHKQIEQLSTQLHSLLLTEQPPTQTNITPLSSSSSSTYQTLHTLIHSINLLLFPYGINPGFKDSIKTKLLHLLQNAYATQSSDNVSVII